jgi:hypothetical protein
MESVWIISYFGEAFIGLDFWIRAYPTEEAADNALRDMIGMTYLEYVDMYDSMVDMCESHGYIPGDPVELEELFGMTDEEQSPIKMFTITRVDFGKPTMLIGQSCLM